MITDPEPTEVTPTSSPPSAPTRIVGTGRTMLSLPPPRPRPFALRRNWMFASEERAFAEERGKVEKLEATVAGLVATVKEQAAQIQKVSAQLEASKPAPQVVNNP
jgi:hypothetical protein